MTTTSRAALASVFATHNPPKPAPTMTTRGRMACGHDPDEAASLDIARVAPVFHVKVPVPGFSVGLCLPTAHRSDSTRSRSPPGLPLKNQPGSQAWSTGAGLDRFQSRASLQSCSTRSRPREGLTDPVDSGRNARRRRLWGLPGFDRTALLGFTCARLRDAATRLRARWFHRLRVRQ